MCTSVWLHVCMYVHHIYRGQKYIGSLGTRFTDNCEPWCRWWEWTLCLMQEQPVVLTILQALEVLHFHEGQLINPSFTVSISGVLSKSANRLFCASYLGGFCEFVVHLWFIYLFTYLISVYLFIYCCAGIKPRTLLMLARPVLFHWAASQSWDTLCSEFWSQCLEFFFLYCALPVEVQVFGTI